MYTKQFIEQINPSKGFEDLWEILDPEGNQICVVLGDSSADALLSHLNR